MKIMKNTLLVNLYAGPGAGKSTGAAYIFSKLKMAGIDSEYVSEYAKDRVWQGDQFVLQHCQLYVTGKQCLKVARLLGKVDVIVTDSPIAIGAMYTDEKPYQDVCLYEAKKYKNTFNIFINRKKDYNPNGRNQTFEEAKAIDQKILDFLDSNDIEYIRADGTIEGYDAIVSMIVQRSIKEDREITIGSVWHHFKGTTATVLELCKHSETGEEMVVYQCIGNEGRTNHEDGIYVRPKSMFLSEVDHEKYPDVDQKYRLIKIMPGISER